MAETSKALQALQINPYQGGTRLVALGVGDMLNQYRTDLPDLMRHGDSIWRAARRALVWWTPERTEQEALRRAADEPSPSVIAQEVAIFTMLFEEYAEVAFEASGYLKPDDGGARLQLQLDLMRSTLAGLERRAQAAEARATDYRLRYEFDTLRKVVAGRDAASKVTELLAKAVASTESIEHLRGLQAQLGADVAEVRKALDGMSFDVQYAAQLVREDAVRRQLPTERLKTSLAIIADVGGTGTLLGQVAGAVLRFF